MQLGRKLLRVVPCPALDPAAVLRGDERRQAFAVVMRGNKPFRVLGVEGQGDGLVTELPASAKEVQVIRVKYQPAKTGELHRQLKIKTDLAEEPAVTVKVEGNVSK